MTGILDDHCSDTYFAFSLQDSLGKSRRKFPQKHDFRGVKTQIFPAAPSAPRCFAQQKTCFQDAKPSFFQRRLRRRGFLRSSGDTPQRTIMIKKYTWDAARTQSKNKMQMKTQTGIKGGAEMKMKWNAWKWKWIVMEMDEWMEMQMGVVFQIPTFTK